MAHGRCRQYKGSPSLSGRVKKTIANASASRVIRLEEGGRKSAEGRKGTVGRSKKEELRRLASVSIDYPGYEFNGETRNKRKGEGRNTT